LQDIFHRLLPQHGWRSINVDQRIAIFCSWPENLTGKKKRGQPNDANPL